MTLIQPNHTKHIGPCSCDSRTSLELVGERHISSMCVVYDGLLHKLARYIDSNRNFYLTFAMVSPIGHGLCGDLVAKTPTLSPFNLGTLTYH